MTTDSERELLAEAIRKGMAHAGGSYMIDTEEPWTQEIAAKLAKRLDNALTRERDELRAVVKMADILRDAAAEHVRAAPGCPIRVLTTGVAAYDEARRALATQGDTE